MIRDVVGVVRGRGAYLWFLGFWCFVDADMAVIFVIGNWGFDCFILADDLESTFAVRDV